MDAQLVWNTWRHLLTSDDLVEWVMQPDSRARDPEGLTADEMAILADYASTPAATRSNIGMYRRGLVRNALGALDLVPLTRRLLRASELDVDTVAKEFTRFTGYADDGPYFWRTAARFVAYLAGLPEFASAARQDVLSIDETMIALARGLAASPTAMWPDSVVAASSDGDSRPHRESARFVANPAAVMVSSSCDLTSWIENPFDFDPREEVEPSPRHWLIYFPTADAAPEYAQLSDRAARTFDLLRAPRTAAELSPALDGLPGADVLAVIDSLAGLGVVCEPDLLGLTAQSALSQEGGSAHRAAALRLPSRRAGAAASL